MSEYVPCQECGGSGRFVGFDRTRNMKVYADCGWCKNTGIEPEGYDEVVCPTCNGLQGNKMCLNCYGSGRKRVPIREETTNE